MCGECGVPVESFTEEDGDGFVIFVARCHGATERQKVRRAMTSGLNFGMAFAPLVPRLPPQGGCYCNRLDCEHARKRLQ